MAPGDPDTPPADASVPAFAHLVAPGAAPERVGSLTDAILDTAPDGIVAIDHEGRVIEFNPAATRIFGWTREESLGRSLGELIVPPELREAHRRGMERFLATGDGPVIGKRLRLEALRKGGERFPVELTITVVEAPEGPPTFVAYLRDLTDQLAAERAREESEWRLREMTEQLDAGLWLLDWDDARLLHANPAALAMLGHSIQDLAVDPFVWLGDVHPDDRPMLVAFLNGPRPDGRRDLELRLRGREGDYRWIQVRVTGARHDDRTRVVGLAQDVTGAKQTEQELRRFRFMVERLSDAVFWLDAEARIHYANRAAAASLRMEVDELVGKRVFDIDANIGRHEWGPHWAELERRGSFTLESEHVRSDGTRFPVEVSVNHVRFGGLAFNCAIVRDITERRRSESELAGALEEARRSKQARDLFIANLSHELRSPLTAMLGFTELLRGRPDIDEEQRLWLELVRRNGRHLDRILSDLLQLREFESGTAEVQLERIGLQELLAVELEQTRERARVAGLEFTVDAPDPLPLDFLTDPTRVRQILDNLLDNALKYTERGGITLRLSLVDVNGRRARVRFAVSDTGVGLEPHEVEQVFERFRRFNARSDVRGAGLGLPIVRHLARTLGGEVELESEPGVGTTVAVELPLMDVAEYGTLGAVAPAVEPPSSPSDGPRLRGRVLLAEDARDLALLYTRWLGDWGLEVTAVADGREALVAASRGEFDLLLLDWRMPALDGLQVARHARRAGVRAPIVGLSAHASAEAQVEWLDVGADAYLAKPVDPRDLHAVLAELLADRTPEAADAPRPRTAADDGTDPARPTLADLERQFVERTRLDRDVLAAAVAADDWEQVGRLAHRLKGSAPSFGYAEVGRLAADLERAAPAPDAARREAWQALRLRLDRL